MALEFRLPQRAAELDTPYAFVAVWPMHPVILPAHGVAIGEQCVMPTDAEGEPIAYFQDTIVWMLVPSVLFGDDQQGHAPWDLMDADDD